MDVIKVDKMTKDYGSGRGIFNVSLWSRAFSVSGANLAPENPQPSAILWAFSAPDNGSASIFGRESFRTLLRISGACGIYSRRGWHCRGVLPDASLFP